MELRFACAPSRVDDPQEVLTMFEQVEFWRRRACGVGIGLMLAVGPANFYVLAQSPASPTPASTARQIGTVKTTDGPTLTLTTDTAQQMTVIMAPNARVVQLAPGSTDLKTAQPGTLSEVTAGDRVLVTGSAGETAGSFTATRLILMKAGAIAEKREVDQADWQKRGSGGLVSAVDATSGAITVTSGSHKTQINTSPATKFRRYAVDSVKFEDTKAGALAQIRVGDQLRVRGARSDDGASIQADEVVSGTFENLSGTLLTIDAAGGKVTLKDLTTKKMMTILVTSNSSVRKLPPEVAARFASRQRAASQPGGAAGAAGAPAKPAAPAGGDAAGAEGRPSGRAAGADLSQAVARLPEEKLPDLHTGDAVMVVASSVTPGSDTVTAVTLLAGVEPILAAAPSGAAMTLAPWSVGSGAPEGGGAQQ